jgi:hypothetical protein
MKRKYLKFDKIDSWESLQFHISKSLKLDKSKINLVDFEKKIQNFLSNNPEAEIALEINFSQVRRDIREKERRNFLQQPFPDNYEMGNPMNRWLYSGIVRTEEEVQKDDLEIEKRTELKFNDFENGLRIIEKYIRVTRIE